MSARPEAECRRGDFRGGVPIRLADGQEWSFPVPVVEFVPEVSGDDVRLAERSDVGPAFDAAIAAREAAIEAENWGELPRLDVTIAVQLLRLNYDLTPADFAAILKIRAGDSAAAEWRRRVVGVAWGVESDLPKPNAAG